jgi:hypothetical protein
MTDNKPKEPYVYKLYDMQDKEHRTIQAIYGVAGCNPTIRGISLDLAEQIVDWLKQIDDLQSQVEELEKENNRSRDFIINSINIADADTNAANKRTKGKTMS